MPAWSYPVLTGLGGRPIVVAVHDGDTVKLLLNCGLETAPHPWLRVKGVHCPELSQPGGPEARAYTAATLLGADQIRVTTFGRSFGRWVATVLVDGTDLAGLIIAAGHGTATPSTP